MVFIMVGFNIIDLSGIVNMCKTDIERILKLLMRDSKVEDFGEGFYSGLIIPNEDVVIVAIIEGY